LLREKETKSISAYMSLIADAIKMSVSEKELHSLKYPFKTIPAMKIVVVILQTYVDVFTANNRKGNHHGRPCPPIL